jgi:uncharacterized RDD family membrane protein YckC
MFDIVLVSIVGAFVAAIYSPDLLDESEFVLTLWGLVVWMPIESFFISRFGATPGKALLRTRVRRADGRLPEYGTALSRSARVWFFGLGVGFPIVTAITMLVAHSKLTKHGRTTWDSHLDLVVEHREVGVFRTVVLLLSFLLIVVLMMVGSA